MGTYDGAEISLFVDGVFHGKSSSRAVIPASNSQFWTIAQAAQENGGLTAAVRLGTGQAIELKLADVCCIPIAVRATAPAAKSPTPTPAPAQGLVAKAEKPSPKKPSRAAVVQLKHVSSKAGKSWGEKR